MGAAAIAKYPDREVADQELFCVPRFSGGAYIPSALIEQRMSEKFPVLRYSVKYTFLEKTTFERIKEAQDLIAETLRR